jgi:hypothetical protein
MASSRTPEGDPVHCPICRKWAEVDPSAFPTADAPCPNCGALLWFCPPAAPPEKQGQEAHTSVEAMQRMRQAMAASGGANWANSGPGPALREGVLSKPWIAEAAAER